MSRNETVADYNWRHLGKAWTIVAVTTEAGAVRCADCCADEIAADVSPVFAMDEFDATCDSCGVAVTA